MAVCVECNSTTIPTGLTGAPGVNGLYGGAPSTRYLFDTTAGTTPAVKKIQFNNASYGSVTAVTLNNTNANSIDWHLVVDSMPPNFYIRVSKEYDDTVFWIGKVTSVATVGSTRVMTTSYVKFNGAFAASDNVIINLTPTVESIDIINLNSLGIPNNIPVGSGNDFLTGSSTLMKAALLHNLDNGTPCFSYVLGTGTVTVLKTGIYMISQYFSYVSADIDNWSPGYLMTGFSINGDTTVTAVSLATYPSEVGAQAKSISIINTLNGVWLNSGTTLQYYIFNKTANAIPLTVGTQAFTWTVQRMGNQ